MSETKFTKGPWLATNYGYEKWSVNGDKGIEICSAWYSPNAYLIAAAPEMYEMLERVKTVLLRTYDVTDYPADGNTDCDIYAAKIDKLLAKARGDSEPLTTKGEGLW